MTDTIMLEFERVDTEEQRALDQATKFQKTRMAVSSAIRPLKQARKKPFAWSLDGRLVQFEVQEPNGVPASTLMILPVDVEETADSAGLVAQIIEAVGPGGWAPRGAATVSTKPDAPAKRTLAVVPDAPDEAVSTAKADQVQLQTAQETPAQEAAPVKIRDLIMGDRAQHYGHIYDRDVQIDLLHGTIRAFLESDGRCRYHTVLSGLPGCGKTEILLSTIRAIGAEHCLVMDGPSTTKAGAELLLTSLDRIPPVLVVEEIEKMPTHQMQWLLQVLDERSEVRRTNARDGHVQRDVKFLCLASVNDRHTFLTKLHGALASRFAHEIYCPRPDIETLTKIALREIQAADGNPAWAQPAVLYCVHTEHTYDPRRIRSVALSGRDGLLDGSYQRALSINLASIRQADQADRTARSARGGRHG